MFDDYGILFVIGMAVTMLAGLIYMLSEAKTTSHEDKPER